LLIGGAGGFTHQKFISMAGDAAEGVLTANLWTQQLPYAGAQEYYNFYQKKYSVSPDYHGAEAYAALFVVVDVLKRADSFRPESIRAALNETNVKTAFGPVVFQHYGKFERQNSLPTMVLQVVDEAFEVVWPEDIATSKLTVPTP
jgi:branched-chain amino acid transport system substrate-binding protein